MGLAWHQNSCAYDATLTIFHSIWNSDPQKWSERFKGMNEEWMGKLASDFGKHWAGSMRLEVTRDNLRRRLALRAPDQFAWGELTSMHHLLQYILKTANTTIQSHLECPQHHQMEMDAQAVSTGCMISAGTTSYMSIGQWVREFKENTHHKCANCQETMQLKFSLSESMPLIAFDFAGHSPEIDQNVNILINGRNREYQLRGVLYFGHEHFTSRIISESGTWFHDGIETGQSVMYEGDNENGETLKKCKGKEASAAIYTLIE